MSLNKVLNRPMFRRAALKKGFIKPIRAFDGRFIGPMPTGSNPGVMLGSGTTAPQVPAIRKPPTFMERMSVSRPVRFGREFFSIPFNLGMRAGGGLADYIGIDKGFNVPRLALETVGGTLASRALPGLSVGAIGLGPTAVGLATLYGGKKLVEAGIKERKRINQMTPEERVEFERTNRLKATDYMSAGVTDRDIFGDFKPKTAEELQVKRKGTRRKPTEEFKVDRLTEQDNESEVAKGSVDINKVVNNNDPNKSPVTTGAEDTVAEKGFKDKPKTDTETKVTDEKANANLVKSETNELDKKTKGEIKAGDGTAVTSPVIDLARKYRKELMAGQGSQAKTVFLANLASGLLSGTTTRGGLGGALEVFGKALGPAVNNYATVKLKENEMENEFMSDALELAQDEIAAQNDLTEGTSGLDFESYGYIQFRDANGNAINRTGGRLKDGTYVQAALGQVDANGRQLYVPVAAGTFSDYFTDAFGKKEQAQTIRNLSGKYKALGIGKETIKILEEAAAKGETLGGPVGRFNLLTTRLGDALNDIGFSMFESKDAGMAKVNQMREDFKQELIDDGVSEEKAEKFLNDNFGSIESQFKSTLKQLGVFKDETTAANLERLAINETVLTYALANSLKDKDRLTQKDIQMAQQLVNVFPLLRGQKQVVRSLEAVNERILGDIKASELNYTEFGGNTATLENFRRKYGLLPEIKDQQLDVGFQNESTIDLLEKLGQI